MTKHATKRERVGGICACGCGTTLSQAPGSGRPRKYVGGHNPARKSTGKPVGRPRSVPAAPPLPLPPLPDPERAYEAERKYQAFAAPGPGCKVPACTHLLKALCKCPKL